MNWETVIGLETHVELLTERKLFCACATAFGTPPNTLCCPVCLGLPGALPILNPQAVGLAVRAALALGCTVHETSGFDRKNYFYPDLPKAYQITQYHTPLARNGAMALSDQNIRIHELHLEEDAGKLTHEDGNTAADFNRCGVPLIEIVTEPDFRSAEEAVSYLQRLIRLLQYLEVSDGKIQEGSVRCDVNVSVRPAGSAKLGTRTELKNLSSFQAIAKAIVFEAQRQTALLESGGTVAQETRRWDERENRTYSMRAKEDARDYRYFPEPDLPPLRLKAAYLEGIRAALPELPQARALRYQRCFQLSEYDADLMTSHRALADFFEAAVCLGAPPKQCANWMMGPILRRLSADGLEPDALPLKPQQLARLIALVAEGQLSRNTAVEVLDQLCSADGDVDAYVRARGLLLVQDSALLTQAVKDALLAHPKSAADYRAGREKAFGFLMGQVMHTLQGRADPAAVRAALREALDTDK